jgi:hypothetical protein
VENLGEFDFPVIVAVVAVRVMEMTLDEIIDVIAMRNHLVAAPRAVTMAGIVPAAAVLGRAGIGIGPAHRNDVLVNVVAVHVMEVPIMQVVDMAIMADRCVAAVGAVLVRMVGMLLVATTRHSLTPRLFHLLASAAWSMALWTSSRTWLSARA